MSLSDHLKPRIPLTRPADVNIGREGPIFDDSLQAQYAAWMKRALGTAHLERLMPEWAEGEPKP